MSEVLKEKWIWLIILLLIALMVFPFIVIYLIFLLPPIWGPAIVTVIILIVWGFVRGYRDWVEAKRKEEEKRHEEV